MAEVIVDFEILIQVGENGSVNTNIMSAKGGEIKFNEIIGAIETSKAMFIANNVTAAQQRPAPDVPPLKTMQVPDTPVKIPQVDPKTIQMPLPDQGNIEDPKDDPPTDPGK